MRIENGLTGADNVAMAQPKLKLSELAEQANGLALEPCLNDFELNKLRLEAKKLIQNDPRGAYITLGIIACIEENIDEMRESHENALRIAPNDSVALCNYARSLSFAGYYESAKTIASRLTAGDRIDGLEFLAFLNMESGDFASSVNLLAERRVSGFAENDYIRSLAGIHKFIEEKNISTGKVKAHVSLAADLLHEYKVFFMSPHIEILEDEESEWLSYELSIRRSVDDVVKLSLELARRAADARFSGNMQKDFSVIITSL